MPFGAGGFASFHATQMRLRRHLATMNIGLCTIKGAALNRPSKLHFAYAYVLADIMVVETDFFPYGDP